MKRQLSAPQPTIRRMPLYLNLLKKVEAGGREFISSTHISNELKLESIQVRKDLAVTGIVGQPGVGYPVSMLIKAIESFLGWDNVTEAFLVGAGNLGSALVGYDGFRERGLNIVAAFDVDPAKIGTEIHGKRVFDLKRLGDLVNRMHIKMGVLTVPLEVAQETADYMVESGIEAIWNFTAVKLNLPSHIIVERVDLAASFAVLSSRLADKIVHGKSLESKNESGERGDKS